MHTSTSGYLDNSLLNEESISLSLIKITPNKAGPAGLIEAEVIGTGFPLSSSDDLTLNICGNKVTEFSFIDNTEIRFILPPEINKCTGSNS